MKFKGKYLSDQLRDALQKSQLTNYGVHKQCGLDEGNLSKFRRGEGGLSMDSIDVLADLMGLSLMKK